MQSEREDKNWRRKWEKKEALPSKDFLCINSCAIKEENK